LGDFLTRLVDSEPPLGESEPDLGNENHQKNAFWSGKVAEMNAGKNLALSAKRVRGKPMAPRSHDFRYLMRAENHGVAGPLVIRVGSRQNLIDLPVAVVVIDAVSNDMEDIRPLLPGLLDVLPALPPKCVTHVP